MKSRLRKVITCVIVFLLLGAIVNVAVAWGCARWTRTHLAQYVSSSRSSAPHRWRVLVWKRPGSELFSSIWGNSTGRTTLVHPNDPHLFYPRWAKPHEEPLELTGTIPMDVLVGHAHGWPLLSMCSYRKGEQLDIIESGIPIRGDVDSFNLPGLGILPLAVLWPGFAINTIFYAAILWLLFFTPGSVRRALRRRRGLCPACAYPVGTSPVCTECGKPVTLRRSEGM